MSFSLGGVYTNMAKLYSFNMVSLNGFFEGPTPWSIEWHNVDEEFNDFALEQVGATGTILFGRVTYEGMANFWPSEEALRSDPEIARLMNETPKVVFSRTLARADWSNSRLVSEGIEDEVTRLKENSEKDIALFGSANLMASLMNVIDEHRLMVNPVVLPKGTPVFQRLDEALKLKLIGNRTFGNGNVLLTYAPA